MTGPDEQARSAFTAKDHVEFEAAATTSPARFLKEKYGHEIMDFDSPSEFCAATTGDSAPSGPSHTDPDELARDAMTFTEKIEFQASGFDSPAAFLKDRNGVHPGKYDKPGDYHEAVAEQGEQ